MKYILDTHTFIWYANGDQRLSQTAKKVIDTKKDVHISIASLWEMAIKVNIGKLTFKKPFEEIITEQLRINEYQILPISQSSIFKLSTLEFHHKDPFDRIIICEAMVSDMSIVSVDNNFKKYEGIQIIW